MTTGQWQQSHSTQVLSAAWLCPMLWSPLVVAHFFPSPALQVFSGILWAFLNSWNNYFFFLNMPESFCVVYNWELACLAISYTSWSGPGRGNLIVRDPPHECQEQFPGKKGWENTPPKASFCTDIQWVVQDQRGV